MKHFFRITALALALCMLLTGTVFAESAAVSAADRVTFMLLCNEGMNNDGGNVGNTMMVVSLDPMEGDIRLMMLTWDTFINYAGYDIPQLIDQPYRQNGPEETMKVFNANFDQNVDTFLSVNYTNLADLIDNYGGVNVDITRAERNALNAMVSSKKNSIQSHADAGVLQQFLVEALADSYYLDDWGNDVHLNGLQAVAFGWLQYDSIYNCCLREVKVISNFFNSVGASVFQNVAFYTNETGAPDSSETRRVINLDEMTESDVDFLYDLVAPVFDKSYHNMSKETISNIAVTLARASYLAARQGYNVYGNIDTLILPLEVFNEYDNVAGTKGHLVDYKANAEAMTEFLFGENN